MSEVNIENMAKLDSNFATTFVYRYVLPDINFNVHNLINNNISIPKNVVNLYISYILNPRNLNTGFTLKNCLFEPVKLIKNADSDKYKYSSYRISFDSSSKFSFTDGSLRKYIIIYEADMTSYVHIDGKNKDVLILGEEPTHG